MAENIFGEEGSYLYEISLSVFHKEPSDFYHFERILKSLRYTEEVTQIIMEDLWKLPEERVKYRTAVTNISMGSPIEINFLSDPKWIEIIILILLGYPKLKKSIHELDYDVQTLLRSIIGLTDIELALLKDRIMDMIVKLKESPVVTKAINFKSRVAHNTFREKGIRRIYVERREKW